jgi:hypothetical protein
VIGDLRLAGYRDSIDIEGWHDPVYRGDLKLTGQKRGLDYLKRTPRWHLLHPDSLEAGPPDPSA